jgi:predicted dehydrogenase
MKDEAVFPLDDLTRTVRGLLEKYSRPDPGAWRLVRGLSDHAAKGTATLAPGWSAPQADLPESFWPLLPWRFERRFVELKRIVDQQTIAPVLMCRFSCMTDGRALGLAAALYRELDLAEWLTGATIVAVTASIAEQRWANVIVRLGNDVVCSVEIGTGLPAGTVPVDRHELIARRGVACDRVVDSQVPQSSVYALTASGTAQYTDTDAELFGLPPGDVSLVRAAYDALVNAGRLDAGRKQHCHLVGLVELAFDSNRNGRRLSAEGVC